MFISYSDMRMVSCWSSTRVLYSIYHYMMLSYGLGDVCISYNDMLMFEVRCCGGCIALGIALYALVFALFAYGDARCVRYLGVSVR